MAGNTIDWRDAGAVLRAMRGRDIPAMHPANDDLRRIASRPEVVSAAIALAGGRPTRVTVQLDAARHVRLRLACAIAGRSAQAVLAEALDAHFRTIPGIERIAAAALEEDAATGFGADR